MSSSLIIAPDFTPVRTIAIAPLQVESSPTSVGLPAAEPGTNQFSYTIQASDFTGIVTGDFTSVGWWAFIVAVGGRNTSGASRTVSYRSLKNGTSIATSSTTVVNSNYYTVTVFNFGNVVAGDVCDIRLWADGTGVNYDYSGYALQPSKIAVVNTYVQVDITQIQSPNFTGGVSPGTSSTQSISIPSANSSVGTSVAAGSGVNIQGFFNASLSGFGLYRVSSGDAASSANWQSSINQKPRYSNNRIPSVIKYRGFIGQLTPL